MRKWIFCVLVFAFIPILSFGGLGGEDVSRLRPVQVLVLRGDPNGVRLQTDTDDMGIGEDIPRAIADMNQTSPAQVFLDTADELLLEPGMEIWLPQLREYLRPSCNLCYVIGETDLSAAGQYLQCHDPGLTLTQYEAGMREMPRLISEEGRIKLVRY